MVRHISLGVPATDVGGDEDLATTTRVVNMTLGGDEKALYTTIIDEDPPIYAFIAKDVDTAIRWLCNRTNRKRMIKKINYIYDNPDSIDCDGSSQDDTVAGAEASDDELTGSKRKRKEKTTKQASKELIEKMNLALVQTVASSQDWQAARGERISKSDEELRYENFAKGMPRAGIENVAGMIAKARSVGSTETMRDWQTIIEVWRRQHRNKRKFFESTSGLDSHNERNQRLLPSSQTTGSQTRLNQFTQRRRYEDDGLTYGDAEEFRALFFGSRKGEAEGLVGNMLHRWKMARLHEEYERLEGKIRASKATTGRQGRGIATVAKEKLFEVIFEAEYDIVATRGTHPDQYRAYTRFLDKGRRWASLKSKFGSGIFALLPGNTISNTWIERDLTQTQFWQWIQMLDSCNLALKDIVAKIEPVLEACMKDGEPPQETLMLELTPNVQGQDPMLLLDIIGTQMPTQSQVQEVEDDYGAFGFDEDS